MSSTPRTRIAEVMSTPVETVAASTSLPDAARTMRELDISALVVTADQLSIVTTTDLLDALADGHELASLRVEDVMSEITETVPPQGFLEEAAGAMTRHGVKHLPVVEDGECVGMVSSTDITAQRA